MRRDTNSRASMLSFVVLDGLARPIRLEGLDASRLLAADAQVSSEPDVSASSPD